MYFEIEIDYLFELAECYIGFGVKKDILGDGKPGEDNETALT